MEPDFILPSGEEQNKAYKLRPLLSPPIRHCPPSVRPATSLPLLWGESVERRGQICLFLKTAGADTRAPL